jgi:hypothetical protein
MSKQKVTSGSAAIARAGALAATFVMMPLIAVQADEIAATPNDSVASFAGNDYACTGIAESKYDPRWDAFPLKIVVATVEGDYLGDFRVTIADNAGEIVMDAHCLAPWLLVDLPAGHYDAKVVARGTFEQNVGIDVGTSQKQVTVHFEGIDET